MDMDVVAAFQVDKDIHESDVTDVFASMLEIEIIALKQLLKSTAYQLYLVHPITNRPIAIDLADIERREERCRFENDLALSRSSISSSQSSEYAEIDYTYLKSARRKAIQLSFRHRRRCILLSALSTTLMLVVAAIVAGLVAAFIRPPTSNIMLTPECILLIGGEVNTTRELVEYYNPNDDFECDKGAIGEMAMDLLDATTVTSGCYLALSDQIVIRESMEPDKPPMVYGLKDGSAKQLPLPFRRSATPEYTWGSTAALVNESTCLSCGGWNGGDTYLRQCYRFDPIALRWTPIAPLMKHLGYAASVAVDNSSYYVIGGWNGTVLKEMYRYDLANNTWQLLWMEEGRQWHSAAPLSDTEFLICGGWTWRADCQIYDVVDESWRNASSMHVGRHHFVLTNLNGSVYAIGGEGADYFKLDSVERYNQTADSWTLVKPLRHPRWKLVAVVV